MIPDRHNHFNSDQLIQKKPSKVRSGSETSQPSNQPKAKETRDRLFFAEEDVVILPAPLAR